MAKKTARAGKPATATAPPAAPVGRTTPAFKKKKAPAPRPAAGRPTPAQAARAAVTLTKAITRAAAPRSAPAARAAVPSTRIKVRARKMGYYEHERRRVGDVFRVERAQFNPSWMVAADSSTPIQRTTGKQELRKKHDEILAQKQAERITTSEHDVEDTGRNPLDDNPLDAD